MASRKAFSLREGETHWCYTFDEPRSGGTMDEFGVAAFSCTMPDGI